MRKTVLAGKTWFVWATSLLTCRLGQNLGRDTKADDDPRLSAIRTLIAAHPQLFDAVSENQCCGSRIFGDAIAS